MPGVVISGYYGFGNTGDEAILAGLVAGLRQRLGDAPITVLSADPAATAEQYAVQAIPRMSPLAVTHALRTAGVVISGGGGLYQDATSLRTPLYYAAVCRLAARLGRPVVALGQGIGPLQSRRSRDLCRWGLQACGYVEVRDEPSVALLGELGIEAALGADLVYLLPRPTAGQVEAAWSLVGGRPERPLGISLRPLPSGADPTPLVTVVAEAVNAHCRETGATPVLLPFQRQSDVAVLLALAERLQGPRLLVERPLRPSELLALAGGLDLLLGMRLHSLIFAARQGVPPVGISYDPKIDAYLARLGSTPATRAAEPQAEAIGAALRQAAEQREDVSRRLAAADAALAALAGRSLDAICERYGEAMAG